MVLAPSSRQQEVLGSAEPPRWPRTAPPLWPMWASTGSEVWQE